MNILSVYASAAHSSCRHSKPATPRHGGASLPSIVSNNNSSSEHCSSTLEAASSLPCSPFARVGDGWRQPGRCFHRACWRLLSWANSVLPGQPPRRALPQPGLAEPVHPHRPALPLCRGGTNPCPTDPSSTVEALSQDIFPFVLVLAFSRGEGEFSNFFSQPGNLVWKCVLPTAT